MNIVILMELLNACKCFDTELALKLVEKEDLDINVIDNIGNTALILACRNELEEVALKLLER